MHWVGDHEEIGEDAKEYDDETGHYEGPPPGILITVWVVVRKEGGDDGAQDVPHGRVGVPDPHDQTTTGEGEREGEILY